MCLVPPVIIFVQDNPFCILLLLYIMEETINELRGKCYVSTADVPHRFDWHKTLLEAVEIFLEGKEDLETGYYVTAVLSFLYAKEIYVEYYGKLAIECGEVYFCCGKALYYLSQEEMFDNKKEKNKAEEDKKEKELSEPTDYPLAVFDEGSTDTKVKLETSEFMKEARFSPQEVFLHGIFYPVCGSGAVEESKMEKCSVIKKRCLRDYQRKLAWEFLEDAKLIFERQDTVEAEIKLAETLQLIASMYRDDVDYSSAIKEYKRSEKIFEKHLKPDDKNLTDTYFKMGVVYSEAHMYPEALKYLQNTKRMLEMECENLRNIRVDAKRTYRPEVEGDILDHLSLLRDIQIDIENTEKMMNKKNEVMET